LRRRFMGPAPVSNEPRMNHQIDADEVRLIDADGEQLGVLSRDAAMAKAEAAGLDLVEVSAKAQPPVCKLMDAGRAKYERKKRESSQRKKQTRITVKEVKLRPKTGQHDFETKAGHARRFLEGGDKVKVTIMFRGREMAHPEIARAHIDKMVETLADVAEVEQVARFEGRNMFAILAPNKEALKLRAKTRAAQIKEQEAAKEAARAASAERAAEQAAVEAAAAAATSAKEEEASASEAVAAD